MSELPENRKWVDVLTLHQNTAMPLMIQMVATVSRAMEEVFGVGNVTIEFRYGALVLSRLETEEETDERVEAALKSARASIEYESEAKKRQEKLAKELGVTVEELVESQKKARGY